MRYSFDVAGEEFQYVVHEVVDRGFTFAMPWKARDLHLNELEYPLPLRPNEQVRLQEVWTETSQTKPPDYLKESELVALMDKHGIGTDASIPGHMQNICDRGYCMVCGPGEDGQRGSARETRGGREPGS